MVRWMLVFQLRIGGLYNFPFENDYFPVYKGNFPFPLPRVFLRFGESYQIWIKNRIDRCFKDAISSHWLERIVLHSYQAYYCFIIVLLYNKSILKIGFVSLFIVNLIRWFGNGTSKFRSWHPGTYNSRTRKDLIKFNKTLTMFLFLLIKDNVKPCAVTMSVTTRNLIFQLLKISIKMSSACTAAI